MALNCLRTERGLHNLTQTSHQLAKAQWPRVWSVIRTSRVVPQDMRSFFSPCHSWEKGVRTTAGTIIFFVFSIWWGFCSKYIVRILSYTNYIIWMSFTDKSSTFIAKHSDLISSAICGPLCRAVKIPSNLRIILLS